MKRTPYKTKNALEHGASASLLWHLRQRSQLTQLDLAKRSGLDSISIHRMERRLLNAPIWKVRKVAAALDVSVDTLIRSRFDRVIPTYLSPPEENDQAAKKLVDGLMGRIDSGRRAELLVAEWEKEKLLPIGFQNGVDANPALNPSLCFDIFSFDPATGDPLFIEVKSTVKKEPQDFFLTSGEKDFMERCLRDGLRYELHYVYDLNREPRQTVFTAEELTGWSFTPSEYIVSRKEAAS